MLTLRNPAGNRIQPPWSILILLTKHGWVMGTNEMVSSFFCPLWNSCRNLIPNLMVLRGDRTFERLLDGGGHHIHEWINATLGEWAQTHESGLLYIKPSPSCFLPSSGLLVLLFFHQVTQQFQALARCQHAALGFPSLQNPCAKTNLFSLWIYQCQVLCYIENGLMRHTETSIARSS